MVFSPAKGNYELADRLLCFLSFACIAVVVRWLLRDSDRIDRILKAPKTSRWQTTGKHSKPAMVIVTRIKLRGVCIVGSRIRHQDLQMGRMRLTVQGCVEEGANGKSGRIVGVVACKILLTIGAIASMKESIDVERYVRECTRFQWRVLAIGVGTVLFMAACFGLVIPFRDQVIRIVADWYGMPTAEFAIGLTPAPSVIVLFAALFWLHRKSNQIPELNCPSCKKFIGGMRYLIVATKCCPHCGKRILEDVA